jgi:hypothetical protein
MSSQRVYLVARPPCAAYIAITFESPLPCASPLTRSLPRPYGRSPCPPWTPAYSARPPIAAGAWYNHLGGRPAVLGARVAGLISVKFCLEGGALFSSCSVCVCVCVVHSLCKGIVPFRGGGQRCRTVARSTRPHALQAPSAAHHALPVSG